MMHHMMNRKRIWVGVWMVALVAALVATAPLMSTGCKGEEEPPPAPKPAAKAEPAPRALKTPPLGDVAPVTLDVLKLMPESAMVSLALPPITGMHDKGVALAKRIVPEGIDVEAEIAKAVAGMAEDADVPDAKSIADIMRAKGLNPEAPIAVFADFTESAASAKAAMEELKEATAPGGEQKPDAEALAGQAKDMREVVSEMSVPAMAGVIGCIDAELVENTLKEILSSEDSPVDASKLEDIEAQGVTIHCYDPEKFAYFVSGDKLVLGNSVPLLKQTAARLEAPAVIRYGSVECPASVADEAVILVRADKFMPLLTDLMPVWLAMNPATAGYANMQMEAMEEMVAAFTGEDPLVMTLAVTDDKIELLTRIDYDKHPALAEYTGEAKPLRLAPLLPAGTLTMLSVQFNETTRERMKKTWMSAVPPEVQETAGFQQAKETIEKILAILGDEVTIAIAPAVGLPQVFVMAGLADAAVAKDYIEQVAPITPGETYEDVEIGTLALPIPMALSLAFSGDTAILATDVEALKGIIDNLKAGTASDLFKSLDPPLDPAIPRHSAFFVSSRLITDVVVPLSALAGGIPAEAQTYVNTVTGVLKELRALKEQKGNWAEGSLTLYLK